MAPEKGQYETRFEVTLLESSNGIDYKIPKNSTYPPIPKQDFHTVNNGADPPPALHNGGSHVSELTPLLKIILGI